MIHLPDWFYDLNVFSISLRLLLAVLFGGVIGLERDVHRHTAGFRTHILVCVGAALAMLTNQYISDVWGSDTDPARIGAQVIAGVGFLGVGTILVTGRTHIRGLTTAAGLWASACLGLAVGIGFYEGALIGAALILIVLGLLPRLEQRIFRWWGSLYLYVEVTDVEHLKLFLRTIAQKNYMVNETDLNGPQSLTRDGLAFSIALRCPRGHEPEEVMRELSAIDGVIIINKL